MSEFSEWVSGATGGASVRSIARALKRSPDSVSRWLSGSNIPPGAIIEISRAYGANFVEGTMAAGIITMEDVMFAMPEVLKLARASQLTGELHRRALVRDSIHPVSRSA